ncbi:hypothetical protein [Terrabacter sp. NPDC000476]|uniref:hypothetical protein n=1 Tax=Terrabacter sp. NPDC000476 TaxID=3154258 RepID=UPI00332136FE
MVTVLVALGCSGCASSFDIAQDRATREVRQNAEANRQHITELVQASPGTDQKALSAELADQLKPMGQSWFGRNGVDGTVLRQPAAFFAKADEAGTAPAQVSVRLCVDYVVNGTGQVTVETITCAPETPRSTVLTGSSQVDVRFDD